MEATLLRIMLRWNESQPGDYRHECQAAERAKRSHCDDVPIHAVCFVPDLVVPEWGDDYQNAMSRWL